MSRHVTITVRLKPETARGLDRTLAGRLWPTPRATYVRELIEAVVTLSENRARR